MGCLFALFAGLFPRLARHCVWVAVAAALDIAHWAAWASQRYQRRGRCPSAA
jgi:hypothetical protein